MQPDGFGQRGEIDCASGDQAGLLQRFQLGFGKAGGGRGGGGGGAAHRARLADDVAQMIFQLHGVTIMHEPPVRQVRWAGMQEGILLPE